MIKIKRTGCLGVLKSSPTSGTFYNKKVVVEALWDMQHKKCCYCEQLIPEEGHLKAVEHFRPKSVFKGLMNDWKNLLLACSQCNGKKSNKFPIELTDESGETKVVYLKTESNGTILVIDPSDSDIDPEEHIDFIVDEKNVKEYGLIIDKGDSLLGRITINEIGLYKWFYTQKRRGILRKILIPTYLSLLEAIDEKCEKQIQVYKDKFKDWMSANEEFAAFTRAFARDRKLDAPPFEIQIPVGAGII